MVESIDRGGASGNFGTRSRDGKGQCGAVEETIQRKVWKTGEEVKKIEEIGEKIEEIGEKVNKKIEEIGEEIEEVH